MRKLLPPQLYLLALTIIMICHFLFATTTTPLLQLIFGVLLAVAGLALSIYHSQLFKKEKTNIYTFSPPNKLVKKGLFQYSRNPMYLGFSLSLLGWVIAYGSGFGWLTVIAFIALTDRWYIAFEERAMLETFGDDYVRYCAETNRWFTLWSKDS